MTVKDNLLISLFTFIIFNAAAQEKKLYEGELNYLNDQKGQAAFQYFKNDEGQIIKDGDFTWILKSIAPEDKSNLVKKKAAGVYNHNRKSGQWNYAEENHQVIINDVQDLKVNTTLNSRISQLQASYLENIPHGEWKLTVNTYKEGKLKPEISSETLLFRQGNITGKILLVSPDKNHLYIEGYTNKAGVIDSVWTIRYLEKEVAVKETRKYENGILLQVLKQNASEGDTLDIHIFESSRQKLDILKTNPDTTFKISSITFGLEFNDGFTTESKEISIQQSGNQLLESLIREIIKYDEDYYLNDGDFIRTPIKTRRFEYAISATQEKKRSEIGGIYQKLSEKAAKYAEHEPLKNNVEGIDSLAIIYNYFSMLNKKLPEMKAFVELVSSEKTARYADQEHLLAGHKVYLPSSDTLSFDIRGSRHVEIIHYSEAIKNQLSLYENLHNLLSYQNKLADKFINQLNPLFNKVKRQEELKKLKADISNKKNKADSLYQSYKQTSEPKNLVKEIQDKFLAKGLNEKIKLYNEDENYQTKIIKGEEVLLYVNELIEIFEPLKNIFSAMEKTNTLYTNEKNKREKKHLYGAAEILFEHYVTKLQEEQDFYLLKTHVSNFEKLQYRMLELREQDTKSLEKALKKEENPDEISKLLKLNF